jgi:hypothetical protein
LAHAVALTPERAEAEFRPLPLPRAKASWHAPPFTELSPGSHGGACCGREGTAQVAIEFFLDGADGYSGSCQRAFFYVPGVRGDALEQLCGRDYYAETAFPTPSGEAALPALQAKTIATIGNVGPTPVLLVFSDRDALFPGPDHRGADPDVVTPEIAMWRGGCRCEASVYFQPNAGHVGLFHRTSKQLTDRIVDWLHHHDL